MSIHYNKLVFWNLAAFAVLGSWFWLPNHGFWFELDKAVFYFFNHKLGESQTWVNLIAALNNRAFDGVALLAMGAVYYSVYRKADAEQRRRLVIIGVCMLLTAVGLNQLGRAIPVERPSPTLTFDNVLRLTELASFKTKDSSGDSFPGDHGLMLMIFTGFAWRYLSWKAGLWGCLFVVVFSAPRVMGGAHWFTDIYVGAFAVAAFGLAWLLHTGLMDALVTRVQAALPSRRR
ncbi:phosphatase PAP2 family protein [Oceanimonas sp. CHS3-5]|uniref:phosphatase PAP2 family protein n=1 Tax=Oceanimonas sp. CHS3-5 TaxID=3068186 RepID=UPI00273D59FE|nr:phosphatase PAP2 family protein [Oceanimonas sp. CHS3-5]MDP5293642.1 phosphatase PAP2 family protein [Oceanimonas sp. CHS3-5]